MSGPIRHLLDRLPEFHDRIVNLSGSDVAFDEIAEEHHAVCDALSAARADDPGETARLARHRAALEEEMIRFLEAGART